MRQFTDTARLNVWTDPATIAVAAVLLVVTVAAAWWPRRQATSVDAVVALRME
jgi:hypothetical protein